MAARGACDPPGPGASLRRLVLLLALSVSALAAADASGVFEVQRKFTRHGDGGEGHLSALREHDGRRHGRLLAAIDLPLGGSGLATETGLYFTRIGIGTPAKRYYVQVDTGSDILWVNCVSCDGCPRKSNLGIELTMYDPRGSQSGELVTCDQQFCVANYGGVLPSCTSTSPCEYSISYGDGSSTAGFFVTDFLQYNQVSGDGQTTPANASISFGCGAKLGGDLGSSNLALDGILGFGQSNSSMLSQLAAAGKVRKMFAHCLDTVTGGGIFAIGNVVQPKVKTTPLVPDMPHYNVILKGIDVGGTALGLPTNIFDSGNSKGTIIDSGTTLAYVPEGVYKALFAMVFDKHQDISVQTLQDFSCFQYSGSVDDGFPEVTFHFEGDVSLIVSPHDYLFQNGKNLYCMGFQNGGVQTKDGKDMVLLGDLVLSNKLVLYDLENQAIGWADYNCSSSIKISDDKGSTYTVNADDISSGCEVQWRKSLILLLATTVISYLML
ncbi:aspartic proteinase 39-like isoform X1 [Oryza glaberrima]|uniref:Peptidase A1 domain-containing protein n=1 Tax=Oryza glaberrima TaxID=4538 RepID=I1P0C1_ORYGL|nr:aspartic proteinase 39-like isoform X1 [Oryza glaberrima]